LWVEPAGGERKSADVEQKMVTLIYPYPKKKDRNEKAWIKRDRQTDRNILEKVQLLFKGK